MQEIKLSLSIEEVNLVLEGLGGLAFARVYGLVGKIQEQAAQQMRPAAAAEPASAPARPAAVK